MIGVVLPYRLRRLAKVSGEVTVEVGGQVTQRSVSDALEARCPTPRGTTRDHTTPKQRKLVRIYARGKELPNEPLDAPLPAAVATGAEPYLTVRAIAGG